MLERDPIAGALHASVEDARRDHSGAPAAYIPELATVQLERTSAAVTTVNGHTVESGDAGDHVFTLQSAAKVVLLAALLEELGSEEVFATVGVEPTGSSFASLARLDAGEPIPQNPLVNTGAIALCGRLDGAVSSRIKWLSGWMERLCGRKLRINQRVLSSERRFGNKNRSIAYLLKDRGLLMGDVDVVLESYFSLCSFEARVADAARLAAVLANGGADPVSEGRVLSPETASIVVSLMATCGMYNESGAHLLNTGLPAKSGVSGVIIAVAVGRAGIAVCSPRINDKGGSVRGHHILASLSRSLGWHFARPQLRASS